MKSAPFVYKRAQTSEEAIALLHELGDDAKIVAGGQSLLPLMNFRLSQPACLVDINEAADLDYLRSGDGALVIGALTRQATLERATSARPWGALCEAVRHVGHYPIRVRGTVGGSLSHADPAAELPLVAVTLGAEISLASVKGRRVVAANEFFRGVFTTAMRDTELLVEVRLPAVPPEAATVFEEFSERVGDFALASACVGLQMSGATCSWARVGLGGVGPFPTRSTAAEAVLIGSGLNDDEIESAAGEAARSCEPRGDIHASEAFRRDLVMVLVRRAVRRAAATLM